MLLNQHFCTEQLLRFSMEGIYSSSFKDKKVCENVIGILVTDSQLINCHRLSMDIFFLSICKTYNNLCQQTYCWNYRIATSDAVYLCTNFDEESQSPYVKSKLQCLILALTIFFFFDPVLSPPGGVYISSWSEFQARCYFQTRVACKQMTNVMAFTT